MTTENIYESLFAPYWYYNCNKSFSAKLLFCKPTITNLCYTSMLKKHRWIVAVF